MVKPSFNVGDKIQITTKKDTISGLFMPSKDNTIIIKLNTGYNIGIDKKNIKKIKLLEKNKPKKQKNTKIKKNSKLLTITILHTGGTIASKVDYETGGVTAKFTAKDLLEMFPGLGKIANINTELVSNMMSEDMLFSDYQKLASAVEKHAKKGVNGIIIGHGTDTLAYTAAALSFMFEKINIPVILVGSQRSSDRGSSDANLNLICAARFIAESDFKGVAICMHNSMSDDKCAILPATKTRKLHTSRRDAFQVVNDTPIALIDPKSSKIEYLKKLPKKEDKIVLKKKFENKVGLLKTHTNMDPNLFKFFTKNYKAIVIEGTGLGHAPTNLGINLKNYEEIKKFIKKGGIVAITSQCLFGRVHPNIYTNLRRLSEIGCVFCEDMLPETAHIKLSWLLGNYNKKEVEDLMLVNLRGEINPRIKDEFL